MKGQRGQASLELLAGVPALLLAGLVAIQVLATADYDPAIEQWLFPPGSKVRCSQETKDGRQDPEGRATG